MKLLVTGCSGFIGFHFCKKALQTGYQVLGIDNLNDYYSVRHKEARNKILSEQNDFQFRQVDIADFELLKKTWSNYKPDVVLHLAAQAGVRYSIENPSAYVHSNLIGFNNVIEMVRASNPENFVFASSSSVYGELKELPFSENIPLFNPESFYAATKLSNELVAKTYSKLYDLPTTGLRFFTVYGSHYRPDMALFKFSNLMTQGLEIPVYNEGHLIRDFTYVDDIVDGILGSLNNVKFGEIYNLGRGMPIKIMEMIEHLELNLGIRAKIKYLPMHPGDVTQTLADISKAREHFGYNPMTEFKDGVKEFCHWFRQQETRKS